MNILTKYLPRTLVYGKCIGTAKNNGIKVYKKITNSGNTSIITSFTPDNEIFKQISTNNINKSFGFDKLKKIITTTARNFKNNTITIIEKEKRGKAQSNTNIFEYTYRKMTKTKGSMDKNLNLDNNAKNIKISITNGRNKKTKNKITTYPDGSVICHSKVKDKNVTEECFYAQNVHMPGGSLVNRIISRITKETPFGEKITELNGNPGNFICQITENARTNL